MSTEGIAGPAGLMGPIGFTGEPGATVSTEKYNEIMSMVERHRPAVARERTTVQWWLVAAWVIFALILIF